MLQQFLRRGPLRRIILENLPQERFHHLCFLVAQLYSPIGVKHLFKRVVDPRLRIVIGIQALVGFVFKPLPCARPHGHHRVGERSKYLVHLDKVFVIGFFAAITKPRNGEQLATGKEFEEQTSEAPDVNAIIKRLFQNDFGRPQAGWCEGLSWWVGGPESW